MELKFSKKTLKKSLSVVLVIMIIVSCMSQGLSAFAAYYPSYNKVKITDGNYATSGKCGDNLTWQVDEIKTFVEQPDSYYGGYYQYDYTLIISGTGAMYDYYGDDWHFENDTRPWRNYKQNITKIVIENGVSSIGEYAFYDFWKNFDIEIPDTVKFIDDFAFGRCDNLRNINLPDSVKLIGNYAFSNCDYLTNVTIPDSVVSIGSGAFYYCRQLTEITIPDSVISIGDSAFSECYSLESVTIGKNLKTIDENAFLNCNNLTEVNISDLSAWCNIEFYSKSSNPLYHGTVLKLNGVVVTYLEIPDDATRIKNYAFYNCDSIIDIEIPNSVTYIGNDAFNECTNLLKISIPDSILTIGSNAFSNCTSMANVSIGNGVSSIRNSAFYDCTNLSDISVSENNQYFSSDERGVLFNKNKTNLIQYPVGNNKSTYDIPDSVENIYGSSFEFAKNLTGVTIPVSVKEIGDSAFAECTSLNSIVIPNKVLQINENVFDGCISLTTVTIPNSIRIIYFDAFNDCVELNDVYYNDTLENWNNMIIENGNEWLTVANKHFADEHKHNYYWYDESEWDCEIIATCICGEKVIESSHLWSEWYENSCGTEYRRCKNCGENEYRNTENVEHNWCDWYYSSGTCGETITQRRYCYNCDTYETQEIKTTDHSFSDWKFYSGTCGKTGREYRVCIYCENREYRDTDVIQHNYRESTYEPTCTNDGKYVKYCSNCGDRTETPIPATGHDFTTYTISVVSCETDGVILNVCSVCEHIEIESTPKTGHNYVNGVCVNCTGNTSGGNTPPTCTNHSYTWETLVEASCTKEGVCLGTCSVCEDLAVDYHDATGHNMVNGACENCDYTENVENEDNNNNENDNDVIDPSDDCSCNCHKSGISNFFFKLALFFQRLFGSNKECACGVAHY